MINNWASWGAIKSLLRRYKNPVPEYTTPYVWGIELSRADLNLSIQDAKADVILKYSADEARNLKSYGEFPESIKITDTWEFGGDLDDDIEFDDVDSDDSGSDERDDIDGI